MNKVFQIKLNNKFEKKGKKKQIYKIYIWGHKVYIFCLWSQLQHGLIDPNSIIQCDIFYFGVKKKTSLKENKFFFIFDFWWRIDILVEFFLALIFF